MRSAAKNSPHRRIAATGLALVLAIPALSAAPYVAAQAPVPEAQEATAAVEQARQRAQEIIGDGYLEPGNVPDRTPNKVTQQILQGLPDGVSVDRVEWITDRWANVYINSAVMPQAPIKVQILLARDWYSQPEKKFPTVWALDGLRATEEESGWTMFTNIASFYADKNVNVILPVGGESSFYSDWREPDNGKHYMWESFLVKELPAVLREGWRSTEDRAIVGLSMGGTGAMNIAERYPEMFAFVGSFSGYLDTTTYGMPRAINYATNEGNGYNAQKMWGPYGSQDWVDHDPKLGVKNLKDMTVYVSAGNGNVGVHDTPGAIPGLPENLAGFGLEAASRLTSETFLQHAKKAGVDVVAKFRDSGTHSWPYWQYEMTEAWPYIADSLALLPGDRGVNCAPTGAIGEALSADANLAARLSACVSPEYDSVHGGKVQDFRHGRAYWSEASGAHFLWGRIGARYAEMGAASSWLGYPRSEEKKIQGDKGYFATFDNGAIYHVPGIGTVPIRQDFIDLWGSVKSDEGGWENGPLGFPIAPARGMGDGQIQRFEHGVMTRDKDGKVSYVLGEIAKKYSELGLQTSDLGYPVGREILVDGGAYSRFENGYIYWSPETGARVIKNGAIFDAWAEEGYEKGAFGFPVEDQADIPAGGRVVKFQRGLIQEINGGIDKQLHPQPAKPE